MDVTTRKSRIMVIVASTRPGRIGRTIADWFLRQVGGRTEVDLGVADLAEWNLPFLDEPLPPKTGIHEHAHTSQWAAAVSGADAFVIVTPEYNRGYPAALKNALDYLYQEWSGKAVAFVSYGMGGGRAAVAQLQQVVTALHMHALAETVGIFLQPGMFDERRQLVRPDVTLAGYAAQARALVDSLAEVLAGKVAA